MNKIKVAETLKEFIISQLNNFNSPAVCFIRPIIARILNNNYKRVYTYLDLLADENGDIDATGIVTDISNSLISAQPFSMNIPIVGEVSIGEGKIEMSIPFINKNIVFTKKDLDILYESLNNVSHEHPIIKTPLKGGY